MTGVGMGELIWLILAVLLGLGVVIAWIIKAEISRNFFRLEVKKLRSQLEASEGEKAMMIEEMQAFKENAGAPVNAGAPGDADPGKAMIGKMVERTGELEKENEKLKKELIEAKSSLEEVYKALCSK
jgi:regulator of replication initiation timing